MSDTDRFFVPTGCHRTHVIKKTLGQNHENMAEYEKKKSKSENEMNCPSRLAAAEYRRIKGKSPKLLGATAGWKTANRVLVGPFKDRGEAQALVNALAKADIAAVPWTSPEGQEIVKLAAK